MKHIPAVRELSANVLQVGVPHVVHRKKEEMIIFLHTFPNVGI